jgi:acetyl esterase/lipase
MNPPKLPVPERPCRLRSGDLEVVEVPRQVVAVRAPLDRDVEHPCRAALEPLLDRPHPPRPHHQVHGKDDPFFAEDLEAAQVLVDSTDRAELFLYPGEGHLFADSSLPEYDAAATALLTERVLAFLETVPDDTQS